MTLINIFVEIQVYSLQPTSPKPLLTSLIGKILWLKGLSLYFQVTLIDHLVWEISSFFQA